MRQDPKPRLCESIATFGMVVVERRGENHTIEQRVGKSMEPRRLGKGLTLLDQEALPQYVCLQHHLSP